MDFPESVISYLESRGYTGIMYEDSFDFPVAIMNPSRYTPFVAVLRYENLGLEREIPLIHHVEFMDSVFIEYWGIFNYTNNQRIAKRKNKILEYISFLKKMGVGVLDCTRIIRQKQTNNLYFSPTVLTRRTQEFINLESLMEIMNTVYEKPQGAIRGLNSVIKRGTKYYKKLPKYHSLPINPHQYDNDFTIPCHIEGDTMIFEEYGTTLSRKNVNLELFTDAANRMKSMHKDGYIHGDIKPDNILVKDNEIRYIDFHDTGYMDHHIKTTVSNGTNEFSFGSKSKESDKKSLVLSFLHCLLIDSETPWKEENTRMLKKMIDDNWHMPPQECLTFILQDVKLISDG